MYIYFNLEKDWIGINFEKCFEHTTLLTIKTTAL